MTVFFSTFHKCYVAQAFKDGMIYTGRGYTFADAIIHCLSALTL